MLLEINLRHVRIHLLKKTRKKWTSWIIKKIECQFTLSQISSQDKIHNLTCSSLMQVLTSVIIWVNKDSLWAPTRRCSQGITDKTSYPLISTIRTILMMLVNTLPWNYLTSRRPMIKFICQVYSAHKTIIMKKTTSQCSVMQILDRRLIAIEDLEWGELEIEFNTSRCLSL